MGERARIEPGAIVGAGAVIGDGRRDRQPARGSEPREPTVRGRASARSSRSSAAIEAVDPAGCSTTCSPSRTSSATRSGARVRRASRKQDRPGGLVVCGMGGSAIGGDLAAAALGDRATRPITTVRGYALESVDRPRQPRAVRQLLGQHRGDARLLRGRRRGRRRRAWRSPPAASWPSAARAEGVPVIGVPVGHAAARGGHLHDGRRARVRRRVRRGARRCARRSTRRPRCSALATSGARARPTPRPRRSPRRCEGTRAGGPRRRAHRGASPGAGRPSSTRTPRPPPSGRELPEANHNEICGWERGRAHGAARRRLPRGPRPAPARAAPHRADRGRGRARRARRRCASRARGETPVERVLSLVMLGDLVSVYLAVLDGVDPTPVERDRALQGRARLTPGQTLTQSW